MRPAGREGGFTLIEVVVAMAILVVAVMPLAGGMAVSWRSLRAGGDYMAAAQALQGALDAARAEADADFGAFAASGDRTGQEGAFTVRRTVNATPGGWAGTAVVEVFVERSGRNLARASLLLQERGN